MFTLLSWKASPSMKPLSKIDRNQISIKCRILGVHATATLEEIKEARDRLASIFHPDKHPKFNEEEKKILSKRFTIIQEAYEFLKKHHEEIQTLYGYARDNTLTSQENRRERSHWVYISISKFKE